MARIMPVALAIALTLTLPAAAEPPDSPPWIGDRAPPISVEHVSDPSGRLAGPEAVSPESIRGKVVVLEFSTTWCAGCILAVPHMNALAGEFASDKDVVFLTVTNESEAAAAAFRERHGLKTALARDEDGSSFEAYWVNGIPGAAVIGPDGRIAALLHPHHITAQVIADIKAGRLIDKADWPRERIRRNWDVRWLQPKAGEAPAVGVRITKTDKAGGQTRTNPKTGEIRVSGLPARTLLAAAMGVPVRNVEFRDVSPEGYYDMVAVPPDGSLATLRELARQAIEQELAVSIEWTRLTSPGYRLRRLPDAAPLPAAESGGGSARHGSIDLSKTTMPRLATMLGTFLGKPVGDDTGLAGEHRVRITWDFQGGPDALAAAMREAGFELVPGDVEEDGLVVKPR